MFTILAQNAKNLVNVYFILVNPIKNNIDS